MSRADEIRANIAALEARIAAACARAGRARADVTLVAVSKTFPASDINFAIDAGITDLGENKVQEARAKREGGAAGFQPAGLVRRAESPPLHWHLIGHLQSNKAKDAVRLFDVIQTIDSLALAERVARFAEAAGKTQDVLLQVNVGGEEQKSGAEAGQVAEIVRGVKAMAPLRLRGLMTIPPLGEAEAMRPYFRRLRALRDEHGLEQLSMGMTDDFEVAIQEGATIVRVGRAIFGKRG